MPAPEPLNIYFISKNGEQFDQSLQNNKIVAHKEKKLGRSSTIILTVNTHSNAYPPEVCFIFNISPALSEQVGSILDIIETHKECLRYDKKLEKYDKFATLEQKLKDVGYSLRLDTPPDSTRRYATDPGRRKRVSSSASLSGIPEANDNKGKGVARSATFNNLRSPNFIQGSIARSNTSTSSLASRNSIDEDSALDSNRIHHLEKELRTANTAKDSAVQAQQEAEEKVNALEEQLTKIKTDISTTNDDKAAAEQAIGKLRELLQAAQAEAQTANRDKDIAERTSRDLQKQLEQKQATVDTKQRELNDTNIAKISLETRLQTVTKDKTTAEQEVLTLRGQLQATTEAKDAAVQAQQTAEREIAAIQRTLDIKTTANKELWDRFKKSDGEKEKIEQASAELQRKLEEIQEKSAKKIEELQALHKSKTIITTDVSSRLEESKKDLKRLEIEKADIVKQMDGLNAEKEQLIREVENLEVQIKTANEAKDLAVTAQQTAESKVSTLQETNRELQTKLEEAEQETVRAKQANAELQRRLDDVEGQSQKDKKDQATQAEVQKPQHNNQDLQLFLQPLQRELKQHSDLLIQKNSRLALEKAGMISTLSTSLKLFAMNNSNREESLGTLKQQIQDSRKTLEQHRNISSRLLCYIFSSKRPLFNTASARLLSRIEKTISPFDTHQSPVEPSNVTETTRPNKNGTTTWLTNGILSHRHR